MVAVNEPTLKDRVQRLEFALSQMLLHMARMGSEVDMLLLSAKTGGGKPDAVRLDELERRSELTRQALLHLSEQVLAITKGD